MENVKREVQSHDCNDIGIAERKRGPPILRSIPIKANEFSKYEVKYHQIQTPKPGTQKNHSIMFERTVKMMYTYA